METNFEKLPQYDEGHSDANSLFSESEGLMGKGTTIDPRKRPWRQWLLPAGHFALLLLYTLVFLFLLQNVRKTEKQTRHAVYCMGLPTNDLRTFPSSRIS